MSLETPCFFNAGPILLAGFEARYSCNAPNDIPKLWEKFAPHIGSIPGQVGNVAYGLCRDMNPESFAYLACVEVARGDNLPADFTTFELPAHRYAVFQHREHVSKLVETADAIWTKWLPESGEAVTDPAVMLERYGEGFNPQTGMGDVEVWLSIK